ncbi:alpha/beta fold hydrolase [Flammeovirga aprica]|uniref:Alpha/beta hydrolase n=1 Tax=Flammeovirga aprica JL-4 TaxID=694437 RepID=A0A7X9RW97_9BACT|nr:alpha/beta hydrolase [Flammeovirga aprica]NME69877.1 alpha/beta hydrolase [Flammeovirga aprica JL-4]
MNYILSILIIFLVSTSLTSAQNPIDYISSTFYKMDISEYSGGEFQLTVNAKSDILDPRAGSHLSVRIDGEGEKMLSYKGSNKPIKGNEWKKYSLRGKIDSNGQFLLVSTQCFFNGKFYYTNFALKLRKKGGKWQSIMIPNSNFKVNHENHTTQQFTQPANCKISVQNIGSDSSFLLIDASEIILHGYNDNAGHFVNTRNIKLYYEVYGEGEPLLLLHGNSQSIKDFAAQIPELSKKYKVIAVDTRGHGQSTEDGTPLSYELFADDMLALINHLKIDKVNVLGWSDGGNTALIMGMKAPENLNKLAVMGAVLYNDSTSVKLEINDELNQLIKTSGSENSFQKRLLYLLKEEPNINPDELKKITCPTLVMAGEDDYIFESHTRLIAEKIENATLHIFKGGRHEEPMRNPQRFNSTVLSFFDGKINEN